MSDPAGQSETRYISGSAAFFNKEDFWIAIERDRAQGVTRIHDQKVESHHLCQPGVAFFKYNSHDGRFVPIVAGKTPDLPDEVLDYDNSNWLAKLPAKQEAINFG